MRAGKRAVVQEQEAGDSGSKVRKAPNPDRAKSKEVDGERDGAYRIAVTFKVSDRRRRDPTGMYETVADVLIEAVRRFMEATSSRVMGREMDR